MRPQTSRDRPCVPGLPLPSWEGSGFSCKMLGPHHPNLPPGPRKALPARVTRFGIRIQGLPSDLLSWGLGMGSLQLQKGHDPPAKNICKNSPPTAPASGRIRMSGAGNLTQQARPPVWPVFLFLLSRNASRGWGPSAALPPSEPLHGM